MVKLVYLTPCLICIRATGSTSLIDNNLIIITSTTFGMWFWDCRCGLLYGLCLYNEVQLTHDWNSTQQSFITRQLFRSPHSIWEPLSFYIPSGNVDNLVRWNIRNIASLHWRTYIRIYIMGNFQLWALNMFSRRDSTVPLALNIIWNSQIQDMCTCNGSEWADGRVLMDSCTANVR